MLQTQMVFEVGQEQIKGTLIYEADFEDSSQWLFEIEAGGYAFKDRKLYLDTYEKECATAWIRQEFPADLVIEYQASLREPKGGNNLNLFFCGKGDNGGPLEPSNRTGAYGDYKVIPNYLMTFVSVYTRLRKDPGFHLLNENKNVCAEIGQDYRIKVIKRGGRIQCLINDELVHDHVDEDPHGEGWVGLRTWHTNVTYDALRIYRI